MNSERLVFGIGGIHRLALRSQRARLLHVAFDLGFRSFDVAPAYGNGLNELELGQALKSVRSEIRITTKFGIPVELYGERHPTAFVLIRAIKKIVDKNYGSEYETRDFASIAMVRSLEDSLRRMGTDHVDRFLIHEPIQPLGSNEAQRLFDQAERLKQQGKIRSFGIAGPANSVRALAQQAAIDTLQIPLSDAVSELADSKKSRVAYGVYRFFKASVANSEIDFSTFVRNILRQQHGLELILASVSLRTLSSFRSLLL
jgi:aryl-alcohol dehydrogenase-like predicted oxidoreductase